MSKMNCYQIDFNGKNFHYQEVHHEAAGYNVLIGSTSFENELVDEDGAYMSDYAMRIDEKFYGFVDDELFYTLTYDEFVEYVNKHFD